MKYLKGDRPLCTLRWLLPRPKPFAEFILERSEGLWVAYVKHILKAHLGDSLRFSTTTS